MVRPQVPSGDEHGLVRHGALAPRPRRAVGRHPARGRTGARPASSVDRRAAPGHYWRRSAAQMHAEPHRRSAIPRSAWVETMPQPSTPPSSRGPGRRPLTAETRVRIPVAALELSGRRRAADDGRRGRRSACQTRATFLSACALDRPRIRARTHGDRRRATSRSRHAPTEADPPPAAEKRRGRARAAGRCFRHGARPDRVRTAPIRLSLPSLLGSRPSTVGPRAVSP